MTTPGWYARGARGASITAGEGAPEATAASGDLYINTTNGDLYRYTTSWALIGNISGADGAPGTGWQTGAGLPAGPAPQGTMYLNTTNGDVYQRGAGSWGTPVANITGGPGGPGLSAYQLAISDGFVGSLSQWLESLKGPKGDTGQGLRIDEVVEAYADLPGGLDAGDAGHSVFVNDDGLLYIWNGAAWPAEGAGAQLVGESAYQIAVANGFVGTEAEWLESLAGTPGELTAAGLIALIEDTGSDLRALLDSLYGGGELTLVEDPEGSGLFLSSGDLIEDPPGSGLFLIPAGVIEDPDHPGLFIVEGA